MALVVAPGLCSRDTTSLFFLPIGPEIAYINTKPLEKV
jgi:hypothetical protein